MELRKSIQKTKNLFHKTLENLQSLLFEVYQKLPKPLSCYQKKHQNDHLQYSFLNDLYSEFEFNLAQEENRKKNAVMPLEEPNRKDLEAENKDETAKSSYIEEGNNCDARGGGGLYSYDLAQKMKALERMEGGDLEHVLDVEEAIHYYSRLRSPVYIDIVDKFFTNIYSEFSAPEVSATTNNNSRQRFGSIWS